MTPEVLPDRDDEQAARTALAIRVVPMRCPLCDGTLKPRRVGRKHTHFPVECTSCGLRANINNESLDHAITRIHDQQPVSR